MKRINIIKSIGLSSLLLCLVTGCNEMLDFEPESTVTEAIVLKTANDYKLFANDFYTALDNISGLTTQDEVSDIYGSMGVSRLLATIPSNDDDWKKPYERIRAVNQILDRAPSYSNQDEISQYVGESYFFRAYNYWKLFRKFDGVPLITKVLDVSSKELYQARASHQETFDLIKADLEESIKRLPLEKDIPSSDFGRISKNGAEAFLARICLYEATYRKYWDKGDYKDLLTRAVELSGKFLDNGEYSSQYKLFSKTSQLTFSGLSGNVDFSYRYLFILENKVANPGKITKADNQEFIIRNRFDEDVRQSNDQVTHWGITRPISKTMSDMYVCSDGLPIEISSKFEGRLTKSSEFINRDPRMELSQKVPDRRYFSYELQNSRIDFSNTTADSINAKPYYLTFGSDASGYNNTKFCTERHQTGARTESSDCPIIRLAEVYLIYAEAKYELNNAISDDDLNRTINKLRARAGLPQSAYLTNAKADIIESQKGQISSVIFKNDDGKEISAMLGEIRREHSVELFREGHRWMDITRWKIGKVVFNQDLLGKKVSGTDFSSEFAAVIPYCNANGYYIVEKAATRKFEDRHYWAPIPQAQIDLNSKLEQNPGW